MANPHSTDLQHQEFEQHEFLHHDVLPHLTRDMRFVGVFYIIYGAFACLTIIGAIIGIPCIIMGLRLRDTAKGLEVYDLHHNQKALHYAFVKQGSFFTIQKIVIIVLIVIMVANFIGLFFLMSSGVFDSMFGRNYYETLLPAAAQNLLAVR